MKNIIWLLVPLLLLSISAVAIAEGNETVQNQTTVLVNETATTAPEIINEGDLNTTTTSTDVTMQQLRVWFTFNQEKKAQQELELARLRLIQARMAEKHNDTTAMQKAMDAHEKIIDAVQARITAIKNKGGNITGLERAVQVHENRIEILNKLLARTNLTEEQKAKIEARIAHATNVTAKLQALEVKVEEIKQQAKEENKTVTEVVKEKLENKTKELNDTEEQNETADLNETNESE
ncbi:MAG: hypothetical protein NTY99_00525 [DPANN group archaeon]|nr:hypothetical protein [DPANN group archaeon]